MSFYRASSVAKEVSVSGSTSVTFSHEASEFASDGAGVLYDNIFALGIRLEVGANGHASFNVNSHSNLIVDSRHHISSVDVV